MTGPQDRQLGLRRAMQEFQAWLVKWRSDEEPLDIDELAGLATYIKET